MKAFSTKIMRTVAAGLVLFCVCALLFGCMPAKIIHDPFPGDFEGTKWVCREADIVFYELERGVVIGTYTVGETTYRGNVYNGNRGRLTLYAELYSSAARTGSRPFGYLNAGYHYDEETGTLVLSNARFRERGSDDVSPDFPETLTFDRAGTVATTPSAHWVADEMGLYLDSFDGVPSYYRGEIVIEGEPCIAYAVEVSPNRYRLSCEKGRLIYLIFEVSEDKIVASAEGYEWDEHEFKSTYPTWYQYFYDLNTVTFRLSE